MAKKKPRSSTDDELAVVKAAAWAWYQRGSGSQGKTVGEFDGARSQIFVYKPSRYKLEAIKITEEEEEEENDNSLLDKYEIESISKRFDQLLNSRTAAIKLLKNVSQDSESSATNNKTNGMMMMMMMHDDNKKAKKSRGFWLRHAVLCGTRQDAVVDARRYGVGRPP